MAKRRIQNSPPKRKPAVQVMRVFGTRFARDVAHPWKFPCLRDTPWGSELPPKLPSPGDAYHSAMGQLYTSPEVHISRGWSLARAQNPFLGHLGPFTHGLSHKKVNYNIYCKNAFFLPYKYKYWAQCKKIRSISKEGKKKRAKQTVTPRKQGKNKGPKF